MNNKKTNAVIKTVVLSVVSLLLIIVLCVGIGAHRLGVFITNGVIDSIFNKTTTSVTTPPAENTTEPPITEQPQTTNPSGVFFEFEAEKINEIEFELASGNAIIKTSDSAQKIQVTQSENVQDSHVAVYGQKLIVKCCNNDVHSSSCNRTLTVTIPTNAKLNDIDVETKSANINIQNVDSITLSADTFSGAINVISNTQKVELKTTSGQITYNGIVTDEVDIESVSGSVIFNSIQAPTKIEAQSVSGKILLQLPKDEKLKVDLKTISGQFNPSGFEFKTETLSKTRYVAITKNAEGQTDYKTIEVDTVSGDLSINAN